MRQGHETGMIRVRNKRKLLASLFIAFLLFLLCYNYQFYEFASNPIDATSRGDIAKPSPDKLDGLGQRPSQSETFDFRYTSLGFSHDVQENYEKAMAIIQDGLTAVSSIDTGVQALTEYGRRTAEDLALSESGEFPTTAEVLKLYLQVSGDDKESLKRSHARMKQQVFAVAESLPKESSFTGRGIVIVGGARYFPMALTAIHWIRQTDKVTPIDLFFEDGEEYETEMCNELLPKLNVLCRNLRNIYGAGLIAKIGSKYALKPLSILASRFDDIYFMDADSYPLIELSEVFDSDVYKERGLLLSADYWQRYVSPHWYDIVGIKVGARTRGNPDSSALLQSDREGAVAGRSTESGQLFIRKQTHMKTLLLAAAYNIVGPGVYYPLLMMGTPGEGDKDTYAAAAVVCREPWYQSPSGPATLGHLENGEYHGYAMLQPNPVTEYQNERGGSARREYLALHANMVKGNAMRMLLGYELDPGFPPLRKHRLLGKLDDVMRQSGLNEDLEKRMFESMAGVCCDWLRDGSYMPLDWDDGTPASVICYRMSEHVKWLAKHPDMDSPVNAGFYIDDPLPRSLPE